MDFSPGASSTAPSGTQRPRNEIPSLATSGSRYSQSSYAPSRLFGVPTNPSAGPPRSSDALSPTSLPPSLRRSSGRVFVDRTPSTQLDVPPANDASPSPSTSTANGISTSAVNGVPTSTEIHPNSTAVLSTSPPASRLSWQTTPEQPRIESGISAPPEHLAARIQSIEADARFLHSERAILHAVRAILHRDSAALHGERATLHAAGETVVEVDEDILIDMSDVSTYTEGTELNVPYTDGEEQDDADDDTEDEAFFDALEELASLADHPASAESSSFSADSNISPPPRPAERPSTIPSYLLHAMADPSATLLQESTSYPARTPVSGLAASQAQSTHRSPQGMPTPPTDRGSLGAEEVPPQPAPPPRSPQPAGRSRPQPAEGALPQPGGRSLRPSVVSSLHRPQPPSLASLEHLLTPRNSIAHMRAAGRPALEPLREAYEFHLRTVPAGTKQVLHDVQYGAPDVAERAALRYGVHDADYLASDDWAMKEKQLEDIGGLVHSTRTVLHKFRYITLTVDTDAKRKDTAEWLDWVRLVKSTCDELKRKFRDCENMHLWAPDYLGKRKERLARYELQIIKTTEAIIKHKQREHNSTFEEARAVWHEQKRLFSENTSALKEDHEEFRMMRHILSEEAERAPGRRSLW